MRSHSVSTDIQGKLQIRIEFRAWRYIAFHQRNQSNAPVSKITLVLIVEATLHIYFRMYVFHLHPLQSQFILNEAALLSFTSSASFCLHHRYRWKPWVPSQLSPPIGCFLSPSGGFLCSIDTDYSILLEILFFSFFFFLLWPRALCFLVLFLHCWAFLSHHLWFPSLFTPLPKCPHAHL